jgi:small conductance mechanosensitive channel
VDLTQFIPTNVTIWQFVFAVIAVVGGWIGSRFARKGMLTLGRKAPGISDTMVDLAARLVQYTLILIGIGVGLGFLGASIQPLIAVAIIAAVVLVLVLRGVADNFAAGVLVQSRQPVKLGEQIQIDGPDGLLEGVVKDLNGRSVIITTSDGRTVHISNSKLLSDVLINESRHGARRSEVQVRVARVEGRTLDDTIEIVTDAVAELSGIHSREPVRALVTEVSPERWIIRVQFWHHPLHGAAILSAVVTAVSAALQTAGLDAAVSSSPVGAPLAAPGAL